MLHVVFIIVFLAKTSLASFCLVHGGDHTIIAVGVVSKDVASLGTITTARTRAEGFGGFF
jgi:hypothetical protein